jgi:glycine betaine/proline transport system permease protein
MSMPGVPVSQTPAAQGLPDAQRQMPWIWLAAIVLFVGFWLAAKPLAPAAFDYPKALIVPLAKWISAFMKWLVNEATFGLFSFTELTRFVSTVLDIPYTLALSLLSTGFLEGSGSSAVQILPQLPWVAVIGLVTLLGRWLGGTRLALLAGGCFLFIAIFGQWTSAMVTLASILVAVPLGVMSAGLLLGIAAFRWRWLEKALHAGARPDADDPGLRLSGADPVPVRLRPDGRGCRDADLSPCSADDTRHHAGAACGTVRGHAISAT